MTPDEWAQFVAQRDMGALLLALVGCAIALIVIVCPRRWRAWLLSGVAIYAIVASYLAQD